MSNLVLSCQHLAKSYTDGASTITVLRDMNLDVNPAEMIAIVGASGSGKSTFLHLLAGLDKPSSGQVLLGGHDPQSMSERERCELRNHYLGFVYQFHHLLPEFSALENVSMPLLIGGKLKAASIKEKAEYLLDQVGMKSRLQHRLGQLSGGERQRVAIARALVSDPACLLVDEPTGNLDPQNAERVLEMFFELQRVRQTSVIMVTHDPNIAKRAQRMFRIEGGELVVQ